MHKVVNSNAKLATHEILEGGLHLKNLITIYGNSFDAVAETLFCICQFRLEL